MKGKYIFVVLIFGFIFAACDTDDSGIDTPTIGIILHDANDGAVEVIKNGLDNKNNGKAELEYLYSQGNQETQNGQIDTFLAKKVDVLAVSLVDANDATNISAIITKAKNAGIPLVFFLSGSGSQTEVYDIEADQNEIAALQGEIIADYWRKYTTADRNSDGKMQYIMVHGPLSHPHASIRKEKAIKAITDAGIMVESLLDFNGEWWLDDTKKASIKTFLETTGQTVEAIICGNDSMALGMVEVLNELSYFADKNIPIVGIDGTSDAITAINSGDMLGTVLQDFEKIGEKTFDVCYALGVGENVNNSNGGKRIMIPSIKITND